VYGEIIRHLLVDMKQQARLHRSDDSAIIVRLAEPLSCKASVETALALFKRRNGFSSLLQLSVKIKLHMNMKVKRLQCAK